jgi:hypothetical protein
VIIELDESLLHQGVATFDHALVSDHRFYDRTVFCVQSPHGDLNLLMSFGVYKNNNVMDGFAMLQSDSRRQFNHRYSRTLAPNYDGMVLGPLSIEVLEPLKRHRLQLAPGQYPASYDIEWRAVLPPYEEAHHLTRVDGRIVRDVIRFNQFATASGWIELEGKRREFTNWFAWRDHSWGVRPGVGGFEPHTGSTETDAGHLGIYLWWLTDTEGGFITIQEDGDGNRLYVDGNIESRVGKRSLRIVDAKHDYTLFPGTRMYNHGRLDLTTSDGTHREVDIQPVGRAWAYKGSGYDHGYNDERGLGVWRAKWLEEYDEYDVSHPEQVGLPDGRVLRPVHREQFARITVNGAPGFAHAPFISTGPNKRYGLSGTGEMLPG